MRSVLTPSDCLLNSAGIDVDHLEKITRLHFTSAYLFGTSRPHSHHPQRSGHHRDGKWYVAPTSQDVWLRNWGRGSFVKKCWTIYALNLYKYIDIVYIAKVLCVHAYFDNLCVPCCKLLQCCHFLECIERHIIHKLCQLWHFSQHWWCRSRSANQKQLDR